MLSELDSRMNIIEASVDDRTEEERGLKVCVCLCLVSPFGCLTLSSKPSH